MRCRLLAVLTLVVGSALGAQQPSGVVARVRALVDTGNRAGAMALADSALRAAQTGTDAYAEALFARAFASSDAVSAERDYARLALEYPAAPHMEEALLLSGEFRMARNDRAGARRQFERLILEFPRSASAAKAGYWAGKMALDDGDIGSGCRSLDFAFQRVSADDVEFRNQVEYYRARCQQLRAAGATFVTDSIKRDSIPTPRETVTPPVAPPSTSRRDDTEFSVQVAAFGRKADADALARRLKQRGFAVRVVGTTRPYRVRVGRYESRDAAVAALGRMKKSKVNGMVVEAERK